MKIFSCLKNIFQQFKVNDEIQHSADIQNDIPRLISDNENIARFIFSPINVNPKNDNLKPNCFRPPAGYDEVSVNRYDYTDENFLKKIALQMQAPKKDFYGLAIVKASIIRGNDFEVIYTPIENKNPFHSDIKIGYTVEKDVELPAEISFKIKKLLQNTILFKDSDGSTDNWTGAEIKL